MAAANPSGGITVSPAALSLSLPADSFQTQMSFGVTNKYAVPITLRFSLEPAADNQALGTVAAVPEGSLSLATTEVKIAPGATWQQTLTLNDTDDLSPGSHVASLAIRPVTSAGSGVAVTPELRLPVTVVKEAGAVSSFAVNSFTGASPLALWLPSSTNVAVHNTGNTIVIPRGYITVQNGQGATVAQGTLNTASTALAPGAQASLPVQLASLGGSHLLPGRYTMTTRYSLGGNATQQQLSTSFLFAAWWQVALVLGIAVVIGVALRLVRTWRLKRRGKQATAATPATQPKPPVTPATAPLIPHAPPRQAQPRPSHRLVGRDII